MAKQEAIRVTGTVTEDLSNSMFTVVLDNNHEIHCHISGKMRMKNIRIMVGDKVDVEVSPYDLTCGRICYRHKTQQ